MTLGSYTTGSSVASGEGSAVSAGRVYSGSSPALSPKRSCFASRRSVVATPKVETDSSGIKSSRYNTLGDMTPAVACITIATARI
jgi:hypothetical protein